MSKVSRLVTLLALALSWVAVSCAGPVAPGSAALASGSASGTATLAAISPWNGSAALFGLVAITVIGLGAALVHFSPKLDMK